MSARPLDKVLPRLERVRRVAPGKWMASCPTREDRSPSLSIRELDDGRVLLYDFGGEPVEDICAAIGIEIGDLFPDDRTQHTPAQRRQWNAHELLQLAQFEASIVAIIATDMLAGSAPDMDRLLTASGRLTTVLDAIEQDRRR